FDPLFAAKGGTLLSRCRSLMLSFPARRRNRSESSVLSWGQELPRTLCRGERWGFGAIRTGSSHGREGFIRFTGFPEREEQYGELSCDGHDGPLLGLGCSLLGKT